MADISNTIVKLSAEKADIAQALKLANDRIGMIECLGILYLNLRARPIQDMITRLTEEMTQFQLINKPLMIVAGVTDTYIVRLARTDQLIAGEYLTIEELLKLVEVENSSRVLKNIRIMEEQLVLNSIQAFRDIKTYFKNTHYGKQFNGLMKSKKTDYLYYYQPDKKHTLRFIAEKIEFTSP